MEGIYTFRDCEINVICVRKWVWIKLANCFSNPTHIVIPRTSQECKMRDGMFMGKESMSSRSGNMQREGRWEKMFPEPTSCMASNAQLAATSPGSYHTLPNSCLCCFIPTLTSFLTLFLI
jgi:hypothetical protein